MVHSLETGTTGGSHDESVADGHYASASCPENGYASTALLMLMARPTHVAGHGQACPDARVGGVTSGSQRSDHLGLHASESHR